MVLKGIVSEDSGIQKYVNRSGKEIPYRTIDIDQENGFYPVPVMVHVAEEIKTGDEVELDCYLICERESMKTKEGKSWVKKTLKLKSVMLVDSQQRNPNN